MLNERLAVTEPTGFAIDSRHIKPGELFIALPGAQVDGHQFVREVLAKGACAALVVHHRLPLAAELDEWADKLLFVENTACALQQLASRIIATWQRPIVGVTASAGKTTIKDLAAQVLEAAGSVLKSQGNLNTSYGLPLTLARMIARGAQPSDYDFAVLEMGMSSFGEIARLADIAPPSVGVVGNVGAAHLEFFGTLDRVARAKAELIDGLEFGGTAVLNADDPRVIRMQERRDDIGVVTFGIEAPADVMARGLVGADDLSGTKFTLQTPDGEAAVRLPLLGRHNVYNALAAAAVAHCFGLAAETIAARLQTAAPAKMRGEVLRFANGVVVINDSYNSNPSALGEAARALMAAKNFSRRIIIAGEMLELGAQGAELHARAGRELAALGLDWLIGVRGLASELISGAQAVVREKPLRVDFCATPEQAARLLLAEWQAGDLVLVKGSRGVRTERVIEQLQAAWPGDLSRA